MNVAERPTALDRIRALVMRRTLHHYYADKEALLDEKIERRMAAAGLDAAAYLGVLERDAGGPEWDALFADITVGETFFFRFAEQFAALEREILPDLLRARAATRQLRVWSAGCSTGAEPYSVAILLHRLLGPALADWSVSILGTDLNARVIEAAREGEYGDWALRTLGAAERGTDFIPVSGARVPRWRLRPAFRRMVRFEQRNLLDLIDGAPAGWRDRFDLVLCRNVLIYFAAAEVTTLAARLGECLAPDGWLLLGHTEGAVLSEGPLRRVGVADTMAWRRATGPAGPIREHGVAPGPGAAERSPRRAVRPSVRPPARPRPGPIAVSAASPPDPDGSGPDAAEAVRRLADAGRLEEAEALCRHGLAAHPLSADLFFYSALLHRAGGRPDAAEADFRRAIYLSKQFVMAHYHLGLLLLDRGSAPQGRRAVSEAARLAGALPPEAELPGGDGMTAKRLRELVRSGVGPR